MKDKEYKRVSLYLDPELVNAADLQMKREGYLSRNAFYTHLLQNYIADQSVKGSETAISERLAQAVQELSKENASAISKGLFRYAVELEMCMRMIAQAHSFTRDEIAVIRHEAVNNVRRTRGKISLDEIMRGYYDPPVPKASIYDDSDDGEFGELPEWMI